MTAPLPAAAAIAALAVAVFASPALAEPKVDAAAIPPGVAAAVRSAQPDLRVVQAELKEREGRRYYDVEGVLPDGSELELDLLQTGETWTVVEIQRDIAWADAPGNVRTAAGPVEPVRVIESRQTDGSIVYELFAAGKPQTPSLEVMLKDGEARVLQETWPH
jgi:hypothetical protein